MARYREDLIKKIINSIRYDGASISQIEEEFGVKTEKTIKKWLDKYYKVKKKFVNDVIEQLHCNNNLVEMQIAASKLELPAEEAFATNDELPAEEFVEITDEPSVQVTPETSDEAVTIKPKYDYLVDCRLSELVMAKVEAWIKSRNSTYKFFVTKPNVKAKKLGMPVVITDYRPYFFYLERDNVEYINPDDLPLVFEEEKKEFEWAKDEKFPFVRRRDGAEYADVKVIKSYFAKTRGIDEESLVLYKNGKELLLDKFFIVEGDELLFVAEIEEDCICWTFKVSDNNTIREIGYKKGHKAFKAEMLLA